MLCIWRQFLFFVNPTSHYLSPKERWFEGFRLRLAPPHDVDQSHPSITFSVAEVYQFSWSFLPYKEQDVTSSSQPCLTKYDLRKRPTRARQPPLASPWATSSTWSVGNTLACGRLPSCNIRGENLQLPPLWTCNLRLISLFVRQNPNVDWLFRQKVWTYALYNGDIRLHCHREEIIEKNIALYFRNWWHKVEYHSV